MEDIKIFRRRLLIVAIKELIKDDNFSVRGAVTFMRNRMPEFFLK